MPWLKLLHIAAVLVWCGALLYLPPAVAAGTARANGELFRAPHGEMARSVFTLVATPAALVAIASGTVVFLLDQTLAVWLVAKLTLVCALVLCHAACGVLLLRVERDRERPVHLACSVAGGLSVLLILAILALVLGKPF
nr:CopD family protein [uncultured Caldimonas sp.]